MAARRKDGQPSKHGFHVTKRRKDGKLATGRPEKTLDLDVVRRMAQFMHTDEEMAAVMGISYRAFKEHKERHPAIQEAINEGKGKGGASIRSKQFQIAMNGNVPMLKWLGVQYLSQQEKVQHGSDPENPMPAGTTVNIIGDKHELSDKQLSEIAAGNANPS
jgi:hypothetical protein